MKIIIRNKMMILEERIIDKAGDLVYNKITDKGEYYYDYDNNHNIIHSKFVDNENLHNFEYWNKFDDKGRQIYYNDSAGYTAEGVYDKNTHMLRYSSADNRCDEYYDDKNNIVKSVEYNPDGTGVATTVYEYNESGNLIHLKELEGKFEKWFEYNDHNQLVKSSDSNGRSYENIYDQNNRKVKHIKNSGYVLNYEYDESGHLIHTFDSNGVENFYEYIED